MFKRGAFFVFEGIDGSGKTTAVRSLSHYLTDRDVDNVTIKLPSIRLEGELMRYIAKTEGTECMTNEKALDLLAMLSIKDISNELKTIKQYLNNGTTVICDRYVASAHAYCPLFYNIVDVVCQLSHEFIMPDILFFMATPLHVCLDRIAKRGDFSKAYETRSSLESAIYRYEQGLDFFDNVSILNGDTSQDGILTKVVREVEKVKTYRTLLSI